MAQNRMTRACFGTDRVLCVMPRTAEWSGPLGWTQVRIHTAELDERLARTNG